MEENETAKKDLIVLAKLIAHRIVDTGGADGSPIVGIDVDNLADMIMLYRFLNGISYVEMLNAAIKPYFKEDE